MMSDAQLHAITEADHAAITAAIRAAEAKTSGEVFAVVAHRSDDYRFVAGFFAALWALILGPVFWLAAPLLGVSLSLANLVVGQALAFLTLLALLWTIAPLRMLFVPRSVAYRRASANAVRQFLAHGVHATAERSGVLLFLSIDEHYAEVVADAGITSKVDQGVWDEMVASLVEGAKAGDVVAGFTVAIGQAGAVLARHFPPRPGEENELDDRLVEL